MIFLLSAGYENSSPDHWFNWLEQTFDANFVRVQQSNWYKPERETWLDRLDQTVAELQGPIVLVGHSCGAVCVSQWLSERFSPETGVVGAVLVAPADVENPVNLAAIGVQAPLPHESLPVPVQVLASSDDWHCQLERSQQFAQEWGAELNLVEAAGHLDSDSGFGPLPELVPLLEKVSGEKLAFKS